jgi:hypothetical protein
LKALFSHWLKHGTMTAPLGIESPLEDVRILTCTSDSGITVLSNGGPVKLNNGYSLAAAALVTTIYDIWLFARPCGSMKPQDLFTGTKHNLCP